MKPRLLDYLACIACGGELCLVEGHHLRETDGEVMEGALRCQGCSAGYPVVRGVPRMLPPELSADKRRTAAAFGYEWTNFVEMHAEYEAQFLDWIHPLEPAFFEGKAVLDAGCGIGRHTYPSARFGARDVIGLDLSDAVDTAFVNAGGLPNVHIVQGDIYEPPFKRDERGGPFDFVYSIGVLHHLPDPRAGFESLLRVVKPGGTIFGWVYGHEGNAVVRHLVNPLRTGITSRLPHAATEAIAWPLTAAMVGVIHGVYRPLRSTRAGRRLPLSAYLLSLSRFSFRQNHSIVFDHLVAPTAFYIKHDDFAAWFADNGLVDVELSWRNQNSWRGRGAKPASA